MTETRADQLDAAFRRFHVDNPRIWVLFERFAFEVIHAGHEHYSSSAIFERIRWEIAIATRDPDGCKLNNNHRAFYARLFHQRYPQHKGFFRNRVQTSKEQPPADPEKHFFLSPPSEF